MEIVEISELTFHLLAAGAICGFLSLALVLAVIEQLWRNGFFN